MYAWPRGQLLEAAILLGCIAAAAAFARGSSTKAAGAPSAGKIKRLGDHYLMLVNTAEARQMDAAGLQQFDHSPYDARWIYGSPNGGYFAFQPETAPRFDAAILRAKHFTLASADTRSAN